MEKRDVLRPTRSDDGVLYFIRRKGARETEGDGSYTGGSANVYVTRPDSYSGSPISPGSRGS